MNEVVERVARAIATAQFGEDDRIPTEEDYRAARAAIKALLPPSEEMLEEGAKALTFYNLENASKEEVRVCLQAAIHSALGEDNGG